MWNACASKERFSMIQSSTSPCLTTMLGALELGSKAAGSWPSTLRKKAVALAGSFGSASCSEKYNLRTRTGLASPTQDNRAGGNGSCAGGNVDVGCAVLV